MNHAFELAGTRFINVDSAADFWPKQSGHRGKLFSSLGAATSFIGEQVLFTHRPLKDPRPHDDHEIGGIGAIDWLAKQSRELGVSTILYWSRTSLRRARFSGATPVDHRRRPRP
ncbi:MAG: hypothetical protein JKX81_11685 [Arenicella sp.]|nr:hypothetical protein [Arenicella sp.]